MTPATVLKIQSHKFGRRKLLSKAAWYKYNKLVKDETNIDFIRNVAADASVQAQVTAMNEKLHTLFGLVGFTGDSSESVIVLASPDKMFIPWRVWAGEFPLGMYGVAIASRPAYYAAELQYADAAGKLRQRIAIIMAIIGIQNDLGNADQAPNVGGAVGADH